ncbi:MAG: TPM domain-containing protein, partial [Pyrinomonas methylaliphatogenes]|nr:TPM domain-containing protein [Pyrinomonas methylaliphatogenes]
MRTLRPLLLLWLSAFGFAIAIRAQRSGSTFPAPVGYVNDFAGVIDSQTAARLETLLRNLKERADIEFAVVTVRTTGGEDIFDYSLELARSWGIGSSEGEKNGLLLLVAVDDRKYFIQVSRHLEGDLPDGLVGEIGRRMRPYFREGRYGEGIMIAVQGIIATLAEKRGFDLEGIDRSQAYHAERPAEQTPSVSPLSACAIFFIVLFLFLLLMSNPAGRGCLSLLIWGSILSGGRAGRSGARGWTWG